MIVEIMLGIFVVICLVQGYALWNLMIKQEQLEDWTEGYIQKIGQVNQNIDRIDYKGYFEADDEVGSIFTSIKETIEELNQYIEEETNG